MELKAVYEYEKPECPTIEENKNRTLLMMVRTGKISLDIAVMCLLCNCSLANEVNFANVGIDGGMVYSDITVGLPLIPILRTLLAMSLIVTLILGLINYKNCKKCEDIEEKERLRKRKNKLFIIGSVIFLVLIVLGFVVDLCEVKYL